MHTFVYSLSEWKTVMQNKEQMRKLEWIRFCFMHLSRMCKFLSKPKAQQSTTHTHLCIKGTKQKRKGSNSNVVSLIVLDSILQGTQKNNMPMLKSCFNH